MVDWLTFIDVHLKSTRHQFTFDLVESLLFGPIIGATTRQEARGYFYTVR